MIRKEEAMKRSTPLSPEDSAAINNLPSKTGHG